MKKTFLLTLALLISTSIFSQTRSIIFRETFDSMSAPIGWSTSENGSDNWSVVTTNKAGGEPNELKFSPTPQVAGISRIITTPVDLTGLSSVTISFRHFFDKKSMSAMIGVATSSNNGQNWSQAWSQTYSEKGQHTITRTIKTADMGKDNVLFCIYFQGNSSSINGWYFDDFEITTAVAIDGKAQSIDMSDILPTGNHDIMFSMQNTGSDVITSFDAQFTMNGETIKETFETELAQYEIKQFTFKKQINLTPDNYNCEIEILSVNGQDDQNEVNNTARKSIRVAMNQIQRLPMIEHFSSSTCGNCPVLDNAMTELTNNNPGKYTYTKYPMNWPTPGDKYYTQEGNTRKNFYSVGSVPFLAFNGTGRSNIKITQEELDEMYNIPAFVDIKGAFNVDGNNINIIADVMPYIDINDVIVHIAVNEKTTTENKGSNSLTEFHHIMMKMLPDAQGSTTSLKTGEYQRFEYTYDMSKTFVEELDDLEVAVWIQDIDTRDIHNSNFLYEYKEHPYPVQNLQLTNSGNLVISWEAPEKGTPVAYNLFVNNELVLENTTELSYTIENPNGFYSAEVIALYENGTRSIGIIDKIIVGCHAPININYVLEPFVQDFDYKHRVTLTWDAVDEADFYTVYVNGEKTGDVNETTFVTGFNGNGTYNYTITSNCASVESEHSEACTIFFETAGIRDDEVILGLYPNPVKDVLHVETDSEIKEITIYNINGQQSTVNSQQTSSTDATINVEHLNTGIYFIKINTEKGIIVKRFIKY